MKESLNLRGHTNRAPGSNEIRLASYEFSWLLFDHAPSSLSKLRLTFVGPYLRTVIIKKCETWVSSFFAIPMRSHILDVQPWTRTKQASALDFCPTWMSSTLFVFVSILLLCLLSASTRLWLCGLKTGPLLADRWHVSRTIFQAAQRTPGELGEPLKAHPSGFLLIQRGPVWVWGIRLSTAANGNTAARQSFLLLLLRDGKSFAQPSLPRTSSTDATSAGASTTRSLLAVCSSNARTLQKLGREFLPKAVWKLVSRHKKQIDLLSPQFYLWTKEAIAIIPLYLSITGCVNMYIRIKLLLLLCVNKTQRLQVVRKHIANQANRGPFFFWCPPFLASFLTPSRASKEKSQSCSSMWTALYSVNIRRIWQHHKRFLHLNLHGTRSF